MERIVQHKKYRIQIKGERILLFNRIEEFNNAQPISKMRPSQVRAVASKSSQSLIYLFILTLFI